MKPLPVGVNVPRVQLVALDVAGHEGGELLVAGAAGGGDARRIAGDDSDDCGTAAVGGALQLLDEPHADTEV